MLTYFCFLKWLFLLNVYVFIIVFVFIAVPQMAFPSVGYATTNTSSMSANTLRAGVCSQLYVVVTPVGATAAQPIVDFLQGTVSSNDTYPCIDPRPRVGLDYQKRNRSSLCSQPRDLRSVCDIALDHSLRKRKCK